MTRPIPVTSKQKIGQVIDFLVEALGNEPSSSLRRAMILVDIDQHPDTTQAEIMDRLEIGKSALNREIDWLFNYGCIMRSPASKDKRSIQLQICGYSKTSLNGALGIFKESHENLQFFLKQYIKIICQEKPTLRDAKILASLYEKGSVNKQEILDELYDGPSSTDNRAVNKLIEEGLIDDNA